MSGKTEIRQRILDAAIERILHYGYAKTTMSEIAKDCDMSAGNIYRFFASKLDIAEAMARRMSTEVFQTYADIAREPLSAVERLKKLHDFALERTYNELEKDAKILEVADVLSTERPLYMNEQLAQERIYIVQILEDGVASGEFQALSDPAYTAEMIQSATMKFKYPQLFSRLDLPALRRELHGVIDLLLRALRCGEPGAKSDC